MSFSSSEIRQLLCPNPYLCGPQSTAVPPELVERTGQEFLQIMKESHQGTAIVSRCSGCNKLAVRRLNILNPSCKVVLDITGMTEVPGGGVIPAKNCRRNLFADAFLYVNECLGVGSPSDLMMIGGSVPADANRTFPIEEEEEATQDPNSNRSGSNKCAQCGTVKEGVSKCKGACGGVVAYCNKECQFKHWKQGHKKVCWKVATSNTFSFSNEEDMTIPVRAIRSLDGFGKSGCCLYYSNHMGDSVSKPVCEQILGDWDPQGFEEIVHCIVTSPIYDEAQRALLKPGEACFNNSMYPAECYALVKNKIITPTDRTLQIGHYPTPHPVCRINLPLYKPPQGESG